MNAIGQESGNDLIVPLNDIPWLQDVPAQEAWVAWAPDYRDVVIVDAENRPVEVVNLTDHNLNFIHEYEALKALLKEVAGE